MDNNGKYNFTIHEDFLKNFLAKPENRIEAQPLYESSIRVKLNNKRNADQSSDHIHKHYCKSGCSCGNKCPCKSQLDKEVKTQELF